MQYLQCSLVDAVTGEFTNNCMTQNGLTQPNISGLNIQLVYKDIYYGTCDDSAIVDGAIVPNSPKNILLTQTELATILQTIFTAQQTTLVTSLLAYSANKRVFYTDSYHPSQLTAGLVKYNQSVAALAAPDPVTAAAAAPDLVAETLISGETLTTLANSVQAQYNGLMALEAQIAGYTTKLQNQINDLVFVNANLFDNFNLLNIDITAGWPV
jgi:hypothetical protein